MTNRRGIVLLSLLLVGVLSLPLLPTVSPAEAVVTKRSKPQTKASARVANESASDQVIAKLTNLLPRKSGIIEPKLGQYRLRSNEPTGSVAYGSSRTKWTGNVDGSSVTVHSYQQRIGQINFSTITSPLNTAKAIAAVKSKLGQPNSDNGIGSMIFKDHQTLLTVMILTNGFTVIMKDRQVQTNF